MSEQGNFIRQRAMDSYKKWKQDWKSGKSKTGENAANLIHSFINYMKTMEENGLIKSSAVSDEFGFICDLFEECFNKLRDSLDAQFIDGRVCCKLTGYDQVFMVLIDVEAFEYRLMSCSENKYFEVTKNKNLILTMSFNDKSRHVRLMINNGKNQKDVYCNQAFSIIKYYDISVFGDYLCWKNKDIKSGQFNYWRLKLEDKTELESLDRILRSFTGGYGIPNIDDISDHLLDLDATKASKKDMPQFALPFIKVFENLALLDSIVLPNKLRQHGYSLLNALFLKINSMIASTKSQNDAPNIACKYLISTMHWPITNYLSSIDKCVWQRKRKLVEEEERIVKNKKVKELLSIDCNYVYFMLDSSNISRYFLRKMIYRFGNNNEFKKSIGVTKQMSIGSRIGDAGIARMKLMVHEADLEDFVSLCDISERWWSYVCSYDLSVKAVESFTRDCGDFGIGDEKLDKEDIGKELTAFRKLACESGYTNGFNKLVKTLKNENIVCDDFTINVLFFHLLFGKYTKSKNFYQMVLVIGRKLCECDCKSSTIYMLNKIDKYGKSLKHNDEIFDLTELVRKKPNGGDCKSMVTTKQDSDTNCDGDCDDDCDLGV